jgi:hypothetical protein
MSRFSTLLLGTVLAGSFAGPAFASTCSPTDIDLVIGSGPAAVTYNPTQCKADILSGPQNPTNDTNEMNAALECAPAGGQIQAAVLTVCRAC